MSSLVPIEKQLDREPVEIVEIITPKCANVFGSQPCQAAGASSAACFNTRATCKDADNYQARPLSHLTPDRILSQGDSESPAAYVNLDEYLVKIDLFIPLDPDGMVFKVGGGGVGAAIYFLNGDIVFRCGGGGSPQPTSAAYLSVDATPYIGQTVTLIANFRRNVDLTATAQAWIFDPIELELVSLGADTSAAESGALFGSDSLSVGTVVGGSPGGEQSEDYNGTITAFRMYDDQAATLFADQDAYRTRYFFDDGRKARCSDPVYILPMLLNTSSVGSRINITGADDRYEPLGRRAFFECSIGDAPHSDYPFDPYRTSRDYDPLKRSTFWLKWLAREKFGRTRSLVRRYTGYDGQALADMRRQTYVLDSVNRGNDSLKIKSRDVLSLTEFRRAQVPAPTSGELDVALTDVATTAFLAGDVTDQYTTTGGTLRINDELMTYTAAAYDAVDDQTDFTGLTRGTDGSTAAAHAIGDNVQLCRRYTSAAVSDILLELFIDDARIPAQLVDVDKIETEDAESLTAYSLSTVVSVPTGIDRLVGELAESCTFYVWWNERSQKVDMQAIKPLSGVARKFSDEGSIVAGSLSIVERPKERISTLVLYYGPRDFAGDLDDPTNFKNQAIFGSSENNQDDQYADLPQIREVFSRWINVNAQAAQTGARYVNRYVDIPIYVTHKLDAKDRDAWLGDFVTLSTEDIVDDFGQRDVRRFVMIECDEVEAGHSQRVTLADVTLDGQIYVITEDGIGDYTSALFSDGNAFITDDDGLNPDGSIGAQIS